MEKHKLRERQKRRRSIRATAAAGVAILSTSLLISAAAAAAPEAVVTVTGNAFFRSAIVEAGARPNGSFGSAEDAPDMSWNPRHEDGSRKIGFRYNRAGNADWSGVTDGDFFLPGAEYEAWGLQVGTNSRKVNSDESSDVAGDFSTTIFDDGTFVGVTWASSAPVDGINISQVYSVRKDAASPRIFIDVTLNNTTGGALDVYYLRSVDPDNCRAAFELNIEPCASAAIDDGYTTRNGVTQQRIAGDSDSIVTASDDDGSLLALGTTAAQSIALYDDGFCAADFDWAAIIDGVLTAGAIPSAPISDETCDADFTATKNVPFVEDTTMHVVVKTTVPAGESVSFLVYYDLAGSVSGPAPTGPGNSMALACTPDPVVPGGTVTCVITMGDPNIDILWRASFGGSAFFERGVTLDASGNGTFTFVAPIAAQGQSIMVELVEWDRSATVQVSGVPLPTRLPAGEGPLGVPSGLTLGALVLMGAAVLRLRRAGAVS
jgi:hypothetical protein